MLGVPFREFIVVTFAGSFVWCVAFVAAGALLGQHWSEIRGPAEIAGVIVLVLLVGAVLLMAVQLAVAPAMRMRPDHAFLPTSGAPVTIVPQVGL